MKIMNGFINSCTRCMNPWIVGVVILAVIGLIIFVPIIGIASLLAALPLLSCTVMCGGMMLMMKKSDKKNNS